MLQRRLLDLDIALGRAIDCVMQVNPGWLDGSQAICFPRHQRQQGPVQQGQ